MQAYHNTTSPKHTDLGMKQLFSHPSPTLKKCRILQYLHDLHNWNTYTASEHIFIPQQRKSELQGSFHRDANSPAVSQLRHSTKTIINLKSSCSEWQESYSFLVDSPHPTVIKGQVFLHCSSRNRAAQNISEDYTAGKHQAGRKACPGHITSWLAQTYLLMANGLQGATEVPWQSVSSAIPRRQEQGCTNHKAHRRSCPSAPTARAPPASVRKDQTFFHHQCLVAVISES